jgi:hypothetical protein
VSPPSVMDLPRSPIKISAGKFSLFQHCKYGSCSGSSNSVTHHRLESLQARGRPSAVNMSYQGNLYPRRNRQFLHRRLKISNMSCSCRPKSTKSSRHSASATAPASLSGANNSQGYAAPHGFFARYPQPVSHGELPSSRSMTLFFAQGRRQCKDHQSLIQISVRLWTLFGTDNYAPPPPPSTQQSAIVPSTTTSKRTCLRWTLPVISSAAT